MLLIVLVVAGVATRIILYADSSYMSGGNYYAAVWGSRHENVATERNSQHSTMTKVVATAPLPATSTSPTQPSPTTAHISWGAYVGDGSTNLSTFESMVGKSVNLLADFEGWDNTFPSGYASTVGAAGKTLVIFWEPNFGYSGIANGTYDAYRKQFATAAKAYNYPVILVPFDEMNLNEQAWGYGANGNTATLFKSAWDHVHDIFVATGAANVKFAIAYNNVSVPNTAGNQFSDYYPGSSYVDYVGVDGFNFGNPWQTFDQVFDPAITTLQSYGKPIYIFSMGSVAGTQKAAWITEGLGTHIETYSNIAGWIWFNQNDAATPGSGDSANWTVNSDSASLAAFKEVIH